MAEFGIEEMQLLQKQLHEHYGDALSPLSPENGRCSLLWMMVEAGEAADVIKKNGDWGIMTDLQVRRHFVEEMCDTAMYFCDALLDYGIDAAEFAAAFREKHEKNLSRWQNKEK